MTYLERLRQQAIDEDALELFDELLVAGNIIVLDETPEEQHITDAYIQRLKQNRLN